MRKCRPTRYAVVSADRRKITYGFKCAACGVPTKRYSTPELRDERMKQHKKNAKKSRHALD